MKKFKSILFSLVLIVFMTSTVFAGRSPIIQYNGKIIKSDVSPYIQNERTMVPIRFISETLGYEVKWDNDKREVEVLGKDTEIKLTIDSKNAKVNDKDVKLDAPASIKKERTFVPLRFVAENLKAEVKWDKDNFKVIINDKNSSSLSLNLSTDEENYVKEIKSLQGDLNKSIGKLKLSFFDNAANLSQDDLNRAYDEANSEITNITNKIKTISIGNLKTFLSSWLSSTFSIFINSPSIAERTAAIKTLTPICTWTWSLKTSLSISLKISSSKDK